MYTERGASVRKVQIERGGRVNHLRLRLWLNRYTDTHMPRQTRRQQGRQNVMQMLQKRPKPGQVATIFMYIYIYMYTYVCIYIYIYIYTHTYSQVSMQQRVGGKPELRRHAVYPRIP